MKAVCIPEAGKLVVKDIDMPVMNAGEVLLKINYVGFCGSDLNTFLGKNPLVKYPVIPGHEIGAEIADTGEGVPDHLYKGMTCTVNPYTSCQNCSSCRNGRPNSCRFNQTMGVQRDGGMCEYISVPWQKVIADPELSPAALALVEPMSVGFHAVCRAEVTDLDFVLVIGCGMIGIGAIIRSVRRGARVIVMDIDEHKLRLAKKLGAHYTLNASAEDVHAELQHITGSQGPDVVIEAVGSQVTYQAAIAEVAFAGRVVYIGYAKTDIPFETRLFVQKELDIRGSRNAMPEDFRAVKEYLKREACPVDELITVTCPPEEAAREMGKWISDPGKVFRILVKF